MHLFLLLISVMIGEPQVGPHVRSTHPYIRAIVAEAQVRSQTFRRLVNAIEATDGIVYVEEGECPHRLRACLPPLVAATPEVRILRVMVDARQEDWRVMSDIGHELQHALEVLSDPTLRTNEAMFFMMSPNAVLVRDVVETDAAVKVGDTIKAEVKAFSRSATTKGLVRQYERPSDNRTPQ